MKGLKPETIFAICAIALLIVVGTLAIMWWSAIPAFR
jgi:hypothetical protein